MVTFELSRRNALVKEQIQLLVAATHGLRDTVVGPYKTQPSQAPKEKAQFPLPVGLAGIDHVRDRSGHDDTQKPLGSGGGGNGLGANTSGRALGEENEADGADGNVVEEVPNQHKGRFRPDGTRRPTGNAVEDTDDELEDDEHSEAVVVQDSSAESDHEEPGDNSASEAKSCQQSVRNLAFDAIRRRLHLPMNPTDMLKAWSVGRPACWKK